uniref:Uncharacterized protein n=1 Tax=Anguilla anguilla TaxID=7936 RepID=A0A0E9QQX2_ANGAN
MLCICTSTRTHTALPKRDVAVMLKGTLQEEEGGPGRFIQEERAHADQTLSGAS